MKKNWLWGISLALVLAIVGLCGCATPAQVNLVTQEEGIWVTGEGEVMAVPDIATLRLGIDAQAATVAEAQSQAAEAMTRVMDALIDNDVAEKDIQTQYFSIRQVTKWDRETEEEVVVGYRVTNKVTAKIREIDKADAIIDAVIEAGGDLTRIDSISFSVDDPPAYYEELRQQAMADAKAKAEQLAELAGVTLGKPTYISEGISYPIYPRDYNYEMAGAAPETPISPGEMEISLTVEVAYAILG
jgi:uncharacterized protein YggE